MPRNAMWFKIMQFSWESADTGLLPVKTGVHSLRDAPGPGTADSCSTPG